MIGTPQFTADDSVGLVEEESGRPWDCLYLLLYAAINGGGV